MEARKGKPGDNMGEAIKVEKEIDNKELRGEDINPQENTRNTQQTRRDDRTLRMRRGRSKIIQEELVGMGGEETLQGGGTEDGDREGLKGITVQSEDIVRRTQDSAEEEGGRPGKECEGEVTEEKGIMQELLKGLGSEEVKKWMACHRTRSEDTRTGEWGGNVITAVERKERWLGTPRGKDVRGRQGARTQSCALREVRNLSTGRRNLEKRSAREDTRDRIHREYVEQGRGRVRTRRYTRGRVVLYNITGRAVPG